ncbi:MULTISPECIES: hypothetical protein [Pseudomonas]|uniref:hypothetical protein n=1 Tax=Pseudomonas TaxID=286 RepID=UPI00257CB7F1|nr:MULTISPECIES: hypothetical protein [Pseudomonas]
MKLGQAEGTAEEIKGFLENHGMDPKDFFERPAKPMSNAWYILPSLVVVFTMAALAFCTWISPAGKNFLFLIGVMGFLWCGILTHSQHKSLWLAGGVVIVGVLLMLTSMGAMAPTQMLDWAGKAVEASAKKDK